MRPLGVGLVWWPVLAPLFTAGGDLAVLELEPQAFCAPTPGGTLAIPPALLETLAALPQRKLIHGVAAPVGGSLPPEPRQLALLRHAADALDVAWASEHLAFNRTPAGGTAALLPPCQSPAGAAAAAASLRGFAAALERPVAFEPGVSYLRARAGEMADGSFAAEVATASGCGLLLDLHNVWTNATNGRADTQATLAALPLDRVWELHLGGGESMDGTWLDAHCAAAPPQVMELAEELIPRLPNLGAVVFEILPDRLDGIGGLDGVARQIDRLATLWRRRSTSVPRQTFGVSPGAVWHDLDPVAWEAALVAALDGQAGYSPLAAELCADPGIGILRKLRFEARASAVALRLPRTMLALLRGLGGEATRGLLATHFVATQPAAFFDDEAAAFATRLAARPPLPVVAAALAADYAARARP